MMNNVLPLERRRRRQASGLFVDFRLGEDFSIEISLHDSSSCVGKLEYRVVSKSPEDFDLDRLREEWARWREDPEVVA